MTENYPDRVWLNPPKFWSATAGMNQEQIDALMDRVWDLAERFDAVALRQFDFIEVGNPYKKQGAA